MVYTVEGMLCTVRLFQNTMATLVMCTHNVYLYLCVWECVRMCTVLLHVCGPMLSKRCRRWWYKAVFDPIASFGASSRCSILEVSERKIGPMSSLQFGQFWLLDSMARFWLFGRQQKSGEREREREREIDDYSLLTDRWFKLIVVVPTCARISSQTCGLLPVDSVIDYCLLSIDYNLKICSRMDSFDTKRHKQSVEASTQRQWMFAQCTQINQESYMNIVLLFLGYQGLLALIDSFVHINHGSISRSFLYP
jgi:hypothetical protein